MSKYTKKQKVAVALGAGALAVAGAGTAIAYWTANGAGSGAASTTTSTDFTIALDGSVSGLAPDAPAVAVNYTFTNPGTGTQHIASATTSVASDASGDVLSSAAGHAAITGCKAVWFTVANATQTVNQDVAGGGTYDFTTAAGNTTTVRMVNVASNQDPCKSKSIELDFASN